MRRHRIPTRRRWGHHRISTRRHRRYRWIPRRHRRRRRIPRRRQGRRHRIPANDVAGLPEGLTNLEGPVVAARRKFTISGDLPPNNVIAHVQPTGARRRGRSCTAKFSADKRGRRQRECVDVRRQGHDGFSWRGGATGPDSEGHVTGAVSRQKAMNAQDGKWRKVRSARWRKAEEVEMHGMDENCVYKQVARLKDKLVVGTTTKMLYKRKMKDGAVQKYRCRLVA